MKERLVALTLLASIGFYNFHNSVSPAMARVAMVLMMLLCVLYSLSGKVNMSRIRYPRLLWLLMFTGMVISIFMAGLFHHQGFMQTLIATIGIIAAWAFVFVLLRLNPSPERMMRIFLWLCGFSILIFAINFATFPNNMFGRPMIDDTSRGMLRVQIPFFQLFLLMIFYAINRWQLTKSHRWMWIIIAGYTMVILSLTRQAIAIMALLGGWQILQNVSWVRKAVIALVVFTAGFIVYNYVPMFQDMQKLSEEQMDEESTTGQENVRIGAWRYYAWEGSKTMPQHIFGNGVPSLGNSFYGRAMDAHFEETGELIADVSWAGSIFLFGYFTTIATMLIALGAVFKRKSPSKQYLTYFMVCVILQGIASGVWYYFEEILITAVALYLVYRPDEKPRRRPQLDPGAPQPPQPLPVPERRFITR